MVIWPFVKRTKLKKQKLNREASLMRVLVIGDSMVSGENNKGKSFADYLSVSGSVIKVGVSGTTLGEYSLYPVEGYSLLAQIKRYEIAVKQADVILLHYGVNDASALLLGNTTTKQVIVSLVKALDYIAQLNPKAVVKFLTLSLAGEVMKPYAKLHCMYLRRYYDGYDLPIEWKKWFEAYSSFIDIVEKRLEIIPLVNSYEWMIEYLDEDEIHFKDEGYRDIARRISSRLRREL